MSEKQQPEWVKNAKTRPVLTDTADKIVAMLPEDAAATVDAWIKSKASAALPNEEPTEESSGPAPIKPGNGPPAASPAQPQKKAESPGSSALDKQKLDSIINQNAPPAPATQAAAPKQ